MRWLHVAFQNSEKSLLNQELVAPVQQGFSLDFVHENQSHIDSKIGRRSLA